MSAVTAADRAALAGDLRYLASRINSWADSWRYRELFEFVSEMATKIRRLATMPATAGATRDRLTALAEYLDGAVSTSSEFEAGAALRAAVAQLRELVEVEDRTAYVAGLRALATFLAKHPNVPVPESYHTFDLSVFVDGADDDEKRAAVDKTAEALGVTASDNDGRSHYKAVRKFGPVAYESLFVSTAYHAQSDALNSYRDVIRLDGQVAA